MPRGLFLLLFLCISKLSLASSPKKQSLLLCRQVQKVAKKIFTTSPLDAFQKWEQYCIKNKGHINLPFSNNDCDLEWAIPSEPLRDGRLDYNI